MFSPVSTASRTKQPALFLASLGLECALVGLLCLMPPSMSHGCCLRKTDLRTALTMPIYLQLPTPAPSSAEQAQRLTQSASAPEVPSVATPVEAELAEAEAKPEEASATAASTDAATSGQGNGGIAPFPGWQMSSNSGLHGFHHQVKSALPVFTPEPPILHGEFPEPARGKEIVLNVVINEEGSIVAVKVLQGVGYGVEQSIVETLKRWVYVPAKFNGMAIASQQELRFQFPG